MKIKKAVIAAAGWGTRFLPITKSLPKEMLPLLNKPLIQYSVEEAAACGLELVVIITSSGKREIEDYFDRRFELENILSQKGEHRLAREVRCLCDLTDICYIRQKEQMGLGHALLTAKNIIGNEPFTLFLPDDIFEYGETVLRRMLDISEKHNSSVIAVKPVPETEVSRYGIVAARRLEDRIYEVKDLVEKPSPGEAPSNLAIMGRYVLTPAIFEALEKVTPGKNGEIQLTDGLNGLARREPVYAYEFIGERYDAGTLPGWLETTVTLALRNPELGPRFRNYLTALLQRTGEPTSRS
ncbi:MAG: UTP--glucose-1-phosphate uridylyltransferase GalU [Dehalococcoidales bacterium]|nr:UTP--glucose-1-phosphate uridylyltransferase GalU [Dehalococcoidales bacterium]